MESLIKTLSIRANEHSYLKDPESSDLGRKILTGSIELINKLGIEEFTFRKLGKLIKSPEASIYRYFENKHKLLLYLFSWYWAWMEYKLVFKLANIEEPRERLIRALELITQPVQNDLKFNHINEEKLSAILISESVKAYMTKEVDKDNKLGSFSGYKKFVERISDDVVKINPDYKFPHMLISTVIESAHHQKFFADHLPRLTDVVEGENAILSFSKDLIFKSIEPHA